MNTATETYNGWSNYETWNVALWLQNDEGLYHYAREYRHRGYKRLSESLLELSPATPDGVAWDAPELDAEELDDMLSDL